MKNIFKPKILDDINRKLNELENSYIDISWGYSSKNSKFVVDFIGLNDNKKYFLKKRYTFSPLR